VQRHMILVCHATDGYFADGNREAVRAVLEESSHISAINNLGADRYVILCVDGGRLELRTPGLDGTRSFHRMELSLDTEAWTPNMLSLILDLMRKGGFGLMDSLDASQVIVTSPQQVQYFPHLPDAPRLVRNPRDLGHTIH
jgi:hypothetical protein